MNHFSFAATSYKKNQAVYCIFKIFLLRILDRKEQYKLIGQDSLKYRLSFDTYTNYPIVVVWTISVMLRTQEFDCLPRPKSSLYNFLLLRTLFPLKVSTFSGYEHPQVLAWSGNPYSRYPVTSLRHKHNDYAAKIEKKFLTRLNWLAVHYHL